MARTALVSVDNDWTTQIEELELFFEGCILPTVPIKLNSASTIKDFPFFLDSHIHTLRNNNGNIAFLPFLERLLKVRELIEKTSVSMVAA